MMLSRLSWAAALMAVVPTVADKDTDFYPNFSNPNVDNDMYWKDAINVLQDLDQFESLFIKYHGCVWSPFGNGEDNADIGCASDEYGNEDYWYLGKTTCFRANVAYSLYGMLRQEDDNNSGSVVGDGQVSSNCNKYTYINSFFTNYGAESFAEPLGIDTTYANSQCTNSYGGNEEGSSSVYTSTTTGCSAKLGIFVQAQFEGAYCNGRDYQETLDYLSDFNDAVESQTCVKVHAYGDGDDSIAKEILASSSTCSVRQYPQQCPDPYGIKKTYTNELEEASASTNRTLKEGSTKALPFLSAIFAVGGLVFLYMAHATKRKLNSDPAEVVKPTVPENEEETPAILEKVSNLSRTVSTKVSAGVESLKESVKNLGSKESKEEETPAAEESTPPAEYEAPQTNSDEADASNEGQQTASSSSDSSENEEKSLVKRTEDRRVDNMGTVNAMLAEKGVTPTTGSATPKKKRSLFGRVFKGQIKPKEPTNPVQYEL